MMVLLSTRENIQKKSVRQMQVRFSAPRPNRPQTLVFLCTVEVRWRTHREKNSFQVPRPILLFFDSKKKQKHTHTTKNDKYFEKGKIQLIFSNFNSLLPHIIISFNFINVLCKDKSRLLKAINYIK